MHQAILIMGFHPTVKITKVRRTAELADVSLCVDEVDSLGTFLELERMVSEDILAEEVQAELAKIVDDLGIDAVRIEQTYDTLIHAASTSA